MFRQLGLWALGEGQSIRTSTAFSVLTATGGTGCVGGSRREGRKGSRVLDHMPGHVDSEMELC